MCPPPSELEELLQAVKWAQQCVTDAQSQQDAELLLQLLAKDDFKCAYSIYAVVSQKMNRVTPTSPLTVQAQELCLEVCRVHKHNPLRPKAKRAVIDLCPQGTVEPAFVSCHTEPETGVVTRFAVT